MKKLYSILLYFILIAAMVLLIPIFRNDYILSAVYIFITAIFFILNYKKNDILFFLFGLIAMTASEYIFISTGVEKFERISLFGIMPLWLPILWAFSFVIMRRAITVLDK
ncbi:hypothetical protein ISR92_03625 [Patescibacteria group bacterium]|nr:hypothetical protein [Patescibacteria group bacterium]